MCESMSGFLSPVLFLLSGLILVLFWSAHLPTYCRAQLATVKGGHKKQRHCEIQTDQTQRKDDVLNKDRKSHSVTLTKEDRKSKEMEKKREEIITAGVD